jgi:RHS repeat-associated protein
VGGTTNFHEDACGDGFYQIDPNGYSGACGNCQVPLPNPLLYYTTDGSRIRIEMLPYYQSTPGGASILVPWDQQRSWTAFFPDGRRVGGQGAYSWSFYDRNNNGIQVIKSLGPQSQPIVTIGDQPGRSISIGFAGGAFAFDSIQTRGYNNVTRTTKVNRTSFSLPQRSYTCSAGPVPPASVPSATCYIAGGFSVVGSIEYEPVSPQTTSRFHTFAYHTAAGSWGELKKQTLPSGLSAEYTYYFFDPYSPLPPPEIAINPVSTKKLSYSEENPTPPGSASQSARTETWSWSYPSGQTVETAPDGGATTTTFTNPAASLSFPSMPRLVTTIDRPNGDRVERKWSFNTPYPRRNAAGGTIDNPWVSKEYVSLSNGTSLALAMMQQNQQDKNGNTTNIEESGYFTYPGAGFSSSPSCSSIAGTVPCSILRTTGVTFYRLTPGSTDNSDAAQGYWNPATSSPLRYTLNAVATSTVTGPGGNGFQMQFGYDEPGGPANVTARRRCTAAGASCLQDGFQYDGYGNLTSSKNPKLIETKLEYSTIAEAGPDGNLYPKTRKIMNGASTIRTFEMTWDRYTGAMKTERDVENNITRTFTYDILGRPLTGTEAGGTAGQSGFLQRSTGFVYDDTGRSVSQYRDRATFLDSQLITVARTDSRGETRLVQSTPDSGSLNTADPSTGVRSERRVYLNSNDGYYTLSSNAFQEATAGWTRTRHDRMGRPIQIAHFSGSALPWPFDNGGGATTGSTGATTISYSLNQVTTTDEAGKSSTSTFDALGRLVTAAQDGTTTQYSYDVQGNLTGTSMTSGSFTQVRVFEYDHHGRLKKAWMPETSPDSPGNPNLGSVATNKATSYDYYDDGSLQTKTDARGVVTTHTYDHGLGVLLTKSYSNGTPPVTFSYLTGGWMQSAEATGVSKTEFTYDSLGRYKTSKQTTNGVAFPFGDTTAAGYQWNLADGLTSMKAPSGTLYSWSLSPANRPLIALGGGYGYAVATLTADGEPKTISYGSGMTETIDRNSRGQVTAITAVLGTSTLLGLTNEFEASTNNGNLKSQTVSPLGMKQLYSYDNRNRLFSATEQPTGGGAVSWSQTFGYDDFGNRWVSVQSGALPGGGPRPNGAAWYQSGSPAVVNNRVTGLAYDAAGNQLTLGGMTGVYDGENRLRTTTTGDFSYDFDAFGRRVRTVAGGKTTYFVYDALGRLAAEYQVGATAGLQTRYLVQDQLGSTRLVTDGSGGVLRRSDYLPYGEEVPSGLGGRTLTGYGADGGVRQSFTGQMRDVETGLDFFGARFYSGALGRFTSADEVFADQDPSDPMSWNLMAYVRNNPLRYTDPTGRGCVAQSNPQAGDAAKAGAILWSNSPFVPGPSCEDIDKADQELKPSVVVEGSTSYFPSLASSAEFFAGVGDSLTFGATNLVRLHMDVSVNTCSEAYTAGEVVETAAELVATAGSSILKNLAKGASRAGVRSAAKQQMRRNGVVSGPGEVAHHINPLFGHPGNKPTLFPTGGLPAWLHSGSWNLSKLAAGSAHNAAHRALVQMESFASAVVNPRTTAVRLASNYGCR